MPAQVLKLCLEGPEDKLEQQLGEVFDSCGGCGNGGRDFSMEISWLCLDCSWAQVCRL